MAVRTDKQREPVELRTRTESSAPQSPASRAEPEAAVSGPQSIRARFGMAEATGPRTEANAGKVIDTWGTDWAKQIPPRSAPNDKKNAETINHVQKAFAGDSKTLQRGQHAKGLYGTTEARFRVAKNLPQELAVGPFSRGGDLRAAVRFSNATGATKSDTEPDRRGIAIRITDDKGRQQDILMTTGAPEFLARDGATALAAAKAEVGGVGGLLGLAKDIGPFETAKLIKTAKATADQNKSVAANTFFSRVPFQMGDYAVKFRLVPVAAGDAKSSGKGDDALSEDLLSRLSKGPVRYELQVQAYIDPEKTPMDDGRSEWDSPFITLAELEIPQDSGEDAQKNLRGMNDLSFSVWNRWDNNDDRALKPLGDVNATRKAVYEASAEARGSGQPETKKCPQGF